MDLPDVNVWLALSVEHHLHPQRVLRYWYEAAAEEVVFCRVTAAGFLRLTTHGAAMRGTPLSVSEARRAYLALRTLPEVAMLPEPEGVEALLEMWALTGRFPARMWTDAYLASFARVANLRLVSLDADFSRFEGSNFFHLRDLPPQ